MLGELEREHGTVVFDMEAGAGTLLRLERGAADHVLVVAEPSAKAIEVAHRLVEIASGKGRVVVLANKVREDAELEEIRVAFDGAEVVPVPYDEGIQRAERDGRAPIDVNPEVPAITAVRRLGDRLVASRVPELR